jgi:hypothetical protein
VPTASHVSVKIYDILGKEVATVADGLHAPGYYSAIFDGSVLSSGIYFYRITAGMHTEVKRMVLVK